ncbi:MAG: class I SAM-dependent rRNA methyltransferase [Deltaproteobacteria bacterium]|nr:class I SAM-dependent rRNA methyltransferase [Deltaproteobacteria bacterium]
MAKVILKRGRAKPLWFGHPWVFAQAIHHVDGEVKAGDVVEVYDHSQAFIGRGTMTPGSALSVRILSRELMEPIDVDWVKSRLRSALALRKRLRLPNPDTNCFRLVNSEGDQMAGLVVDIYGEAVVVQFTTGGMHRMSGWVFDALRELLSPQVIAAVAPNSFAEREKIDAKAELVQGKSSEVLVRENGLVYGVDLLGGQKTGLYLDQRDNHALVGRLAHGAKVVDLYAYHGGFALNALKGGAAHVTAVDGSARAVQQILDNARQNRFEVEAVEADAFRYLATVKPKSVDLMVIDPPKFARSRKELPSALKGYRKLHRRAMESVAPGGLLCSAICSQLVNSEEMLRLIAQAAKDEGRVARLVHSGGPGADHPRLPAFPEGDYLKFVICELS